VVRFTRLGHAIMDTYKEGVTNGHVQDDTGRSQGVRRTYKSKVRWGLQVALCARATSQTTHIAARHARRTRLVLCLVCKASCIARRVRISENCSSSLCEISIHIPTSSQPGSMPRTYPSRRMDVSTLALTPSL